MEGQQLKEINEEHNKELGQLIEEEQCLRMEQHELLERLRMRTGQKGKEKKGDKSQRGYRKGKLGERGRTTRRNHEEQKDLLDEL